MIRPVLLLAIPINRCPSVTGSTWGGRRLALMVLEGVGYIIRVEEL